MMTPDSRRVDERGTRADSAGRESAVDLFGRHPIAIDGCVFGWTVGDSTSLEILDSFAANGGRVVSTADHYAGGRSEVMIGKWLATVPDRADVVIATKVGRHPDARGLSARAIRSAVDASLRRLGTDYIDLLSFDGDHPETPIDESLEAVDALRRAGKVRRLSASGFSGARIDEIDGLARSAVYPTFATVMCEYSLMRRDVFEDDLAPVLRRLGIPAVARLPLASGYLTGDYRSRNDLPDSPMFMGALEHSGRRGARVLDGVQKVADEQGVALGAVALAWLLSKPEVGLTMVRVPHVEHLTGLLPASEIQLTRGQVSLLDRISA